MASHNADLILSYLEIFAYLVHLKNKPSELHQEWVEIDFLH